MFNPEKQFNTPSNDKEKRKEVLRQQMLDTVIKPYEYYRLGEDARKKSGAQYGTGTYFKEELIGYDPNRKAHEALSYLSESVRRLVGAHGIGSNVPVGLSPEQQNKLALMALLQIMATGELKGDFALLKNDTMVSVFDDAPFILLSNKGEPLAENKGGKIMITNLRAVLVNGQYEPMIEELKKRFLGVNFKTAEEITDQTFDSRSETFKSFEEQIDEKIRRETK